MKKGTRLDQFLADQGLSRSREKAKKEIMAGWVKVNGETIHQPSRQIKGTEEIEVTRPKGDFVSRGGEKLKQALDFFSLEVTDRVAVDMGASTGGFTHCLLQHGAARVYAIDVGYGQLDYSLRSDDRVVVMERTNVRHLVAENFEGVGLITADLSFISFRKVYPVVAEIFPGSEGVFLLKPQFEAEQGEHKKGVVRKEEVHCAIIARVLAALIEEGMIFRGLTYSPITGPAGNIEFLVHFEAPGTPGNEESPELDFLIKSVVAEAHQNFKKS